MTARLVEVRRTERLIPRMVRVLFGGELVGFAAGSFTDHYVKIDSRRLEPPTRRRSRTRSRRSGSRWTSGRARPLHGRHFDHERQELAVDFVVHGDIGVAGRWAIAARPGDKQQLLGPGQCLRAAPRRRLAPADRRRQRDPAIAAALERLTDDAIAHVVLAADEQPLATPAGTTIHWVDDLPAAVAALDFPAGTPHVLLHGEASDVREKRLVDEDDAQDVHRSPEVAHSAAGSGARS